MFFGDFEIRHGFVVLEEQRGEERGKVFKVHIGRERFLKEKSLNASIFEMVGIMWTNSLLLSTLGDVKL